MTELFSWAIFLALSLIAVVTAAGMIITMSMYRAGLALMASFVALAGLFLLLDADLLAAIQVMMNVGGMLIMVLFMVMIMMDPGGEMMWDMKRKMHLPGLGAFSMAMPRSKAPSEEVTQEDQSAPSAQVQSYTCPMHPEIIQDHPGTCPKCGMTLIPVEQGKEPSSQPDQQSMTSMGHESHTMKMPQLSAEQHDEMMEGMAMSTAQLPWALILGALSALLLIVLVWMTPWPLARGGPTQDATTMVGELLLSRYMIGFEGAAFLILAGIAGAVILAKRESQPLQPESGRPAEREKPPEMASAQTGTMYICPMHPEIRQDHPGTCPKCGMTLVPQATV